MPSARADALCARAVALCARAVVLPCMRLQGRLQFADTVYEYALK